MNAQTDGARFAGIQVYDQESSLQHTASLSWDSLRNHWVYSNPSGSYHGGGLISGPRNTGSLGDETYPTSNTIVRGQGGDHIYDSNITDDDTTVKIKINTQVTGSLTLTGALSGTSATFNGTSASPVLTLSNSTGGTKADFTITENTGLIVNSYESTSARSIDFRVAGTSALLIASSGAATFASSVTANSLVIRNTGVPAAQFFRDLDVVSVGTAGQNIEFGARSGSTFIAGALIGGNLDNPATTGNLIFQTLNGGTLGTRLTITNTGAATFSSSVTAPFIRITDSAGEIGEINSTNANGGYITWRTSGTTIADLGTAQQIFGTGGNDTFGINGRGARALTFGTNNTERMRITSGGDVGIGTTPSYKLDVNGSQRWIFRNNSSEVTDLLVSTESANSKSKLSFLWYGSETAALKFKRGGDSTGGEIELWTQQEGSSIAQRLTINTSGNVGIGTTSPEALLHLSQASTGGNGAFIFVDNPASSTLGNTAGIRFATNAGASFSGYGSFIQAVNTNAGNGAEALTFGTWDGASRSERMRINSNGDVGIGLTNPGAILDVSHTAGTTNIIRVSNGAGNYRWRVDQLFSMVMTNASNVDTFSVTTAGNITTAGSITINSRTVFTTAALYDNASAGNNVGIGFGPNSVLPLTGDGSASNGTKDLGSSSVRWATVFTSDLSLSNGIGDYTIVEGENDLFLYNNKQNKVYKFVIEEVDPSTATPKKS